MPPLQVALLNLGTESEWQVLRRDAEIERSVEQLYQAWRRITIFTVPLQRVIFSEMRFGDEAKERVAADIGIGPSGQEMRSRRGGQMRGIYFGWHRDEAKKDGEHFSFSG